MANRHRGEISVMLDGKEWILCLTLGALSDLEDHFEVTNLSALAEKLSSGTLSSRNILAIISAGMKGGGYILTPDEVAEMRVENGAAGYANIVADLLCATFSRADDKSR